MKRAGKTAVRARARDRHAPFLERLAQHLEHVAAELEHLVEEQHAVMREADLAGPRLRPAADQRGVRDRVMRRAKRPLDDRARAPGGSRPATEWTAVTSSASSKVSGGRIPATRRAIIVFPGAGRPDEQEIVAAGGGDLERAAREQLAADVREVGRWRRRWAGGAGRSRERVARKACCPGR